MPASTLLRELFHLMIINSLYQVWNTVEENVQVIHHTSREYNKVESSCKNEDGGTPELNLTMAFNHAANLVKATALMCDLHNFGGWQALK